MRQNRVKFIVFPMILLFLSGMSRVHGQGPALGKLLGLSVTGNKTSEAGVIKLSSG